MLSYDTINKNDLCTYLTPSHLSASLPSSIVQAHLFSSSYKPRVLQPEQTLEATDLWLSSHSIYFRYFYSKILVQR